MSELHLSGKATDHIWLMEDGEEPHVIGVRVDCGDSGALYLTRSQARGLSEQLRKFVAISGEPREVPVVRRKGHSALRKIKGEPGLQTFDPHPVAKAGEFDARAFAEKLFGDSDIRDCEIELANTAYAAGAASGPQPSTRAYAHKTIDRVQEMRKLDLERAHDPKLAHEKDYYLGRAHRCDDILFWLSEMESRLPVVAAPAVAQAELSEEQVREWIKEFRATKLQCDVSAGFPGFIMNKVDALLRSKAAEGGKETKA